MIKTTGNASVNVIDLAMQQNSKIIFSANELHMGKGDHIHANHLLDFTLNKDFHLKNPQHHNIHITPQAINANNNNVALDLTLQDIQHLQNLSEFFESHSYQLDVIQAKLLGLNNTQTMTSNANIILSLPMIFDALDNLQTVILSGMNEET